MKKWTILLLSFSICNIFFAQENASTTEGEDELTIEQELEKLNSVVDLIQNFYVTEQDDGDLVENAIKGMLKELDPHSVYISKKEVEKMNEPLVGNFEGVGIQFNILEDSIFVVATIAGGPSEKVGIQAGDRIVKIDGEDVAGIGISNNDVIGYLRGEKGTEVTVDIKRSGTKRLIEFNITRDKIPLYSVDAAYMVDEEIGYIKVNRFASKTPQEFRNAILELKQEGMTNLIVDLQGNGGGYLNAAFQMVDEFLDEGKLIVYTEGENSPRNEMNATGYGNYEEGKVVVLVDQYSASASEILSGAIQDWDRGLVIGRRTFGKGLVQRPFTLSDGAQIRLTIANYYTPSGRFIQKPYENGTEEYRKDINNRFESGELTDSIIANIPDSLKYETENGRIVYGGGGITPDIFVALDTSAISDYYTDARSAGLINKFALNYADKHREELLSYYTDVRLFDENFEADELLSDFIDYAEDEDIEKNKSDIAKSGNLIGVQLKALVARNLYDGEAFYYIYNKELDLVFQKAVEAIKNDYFKNYDITWTKK